MPVDRPRPAAATHMGWNRVYAKAGDVCSAASKKGLLLLRAQLRHAGQPVHHRPVQLQQAFTAAVQKITSLACSSPGALRERRAQLLKNFLEM